MEKMLQEKKLRMLQKKKEMLMEKLKQHLYTLIQCTPLLAGVAPVVTFRITARKQERVQARYSLWI